jgi:flagellar assembly protein FliH
MPEAISMLAKVLREEELQKKPLCAWPATHSAHTQEKPSRTESGASSDFARSESLENEIRRLQRELQQLRADTEQRIEEARLQGKREGDQQAKASYEQQLATELSPIRTLVEQLRSLAPTLRRQTEEELVRLAVSVARRILHRELTIDPDALAGLLKVAFSKAEQYQIQQIRTDARSAAFIEQSLKGFGRPEGIRVVADPTLPLGSVLMEFPKGQLDASIATQLQEIERGFVDLVRHS